MSGFLDVKDLDACLADLMARSIERALVVIDYAESAEEEVAEILRVANKRNLTSLRILLLARGAGFWWHRLKRIVGSAGDWLRHEPYRLKPLTLDIVHRRHSYRLARHAFAEKLGKSEPDLEPEDIAAPHYERILLLHMSALLVIDGIQAQGMDEILQLVLNREISNWAKQLKNHQLPKNLEAGFERAMGIISAYGGVRDKEEAIKLISMVRFFRDRKNAEIEAIAEILHSCFPGSHWIEPIQPDLLMEFLVKKATLENPQDFKDIILPKME